MPTKKTPVKKKTTKKTSHLTAQFTADIPEELTLGCCQKKKPSKNWGKNTSEAFYFLGMIGAAIYYISIATGFRMGVLGVLKAFVRPVFLVHGLLKFLAL